MLLPAPLLFHAHLNLGFALFFAIFEMSRTRALEASSYVDEMYRTYRPSHARPLTIVEESDQNPTSALAFSKASSPARVAQSLVLVSGGGASIHLYRAAASN